MRFGLLGIGLALLTATPARPAAAGDDVNTAAKSRQRGRDLPVSLSVFRQRDIDRRGIEDIRQLQYQVPSMVAGNGLSQITLRGIGADAIGPATEAGFALRQNGVYASRLDLAYLGFFDLQRVEILRGPQGVLYGHNATGGAMNLLARRPDDELSAAADVQYGNYDATRVRGAFNVPVVADRAALRVALLHNRRRGYYRERFADQRSLDANDSAVRGSLYWRMRGDLRLDFSWQYARTDGNGADHKLRGDPHPTGSGGLGIDDFDGALPSPRSARAGNEGFRQDLDRELHFGTLELTWNVRDFTIRSISGYQSHDAFESYDADHSELGVRVAKTFDDVRTWSTDLEILFEDGGPFRFNFGVDYLNEKSEGSGADLRQLQQTAAVRGILPAANRALAAAGRDLFPEDFEDRARLFAVAHNQTVGGFAYGSYEMFERLRIRGGLRITHTARRFDDRSTNSDHILDPDFAAGRLPLYVLEHGHVQSGDWSALPWHAGLDFDLDESTLVYATVSTANRPGGFTYLNEEAVAEEEILALELGAKSSLFDDRLRLDLAAFRYDYEDLQVRAAAATGDLPRASNIPDAVLWGVEIGTFAEPLANLVFNGSFGWLDSRVASDFVAGAREPCTGGSVAAPCSGAIDSDRYRIDAATTRNVKGNELARAPRFSVNFGLQYAYSLARFDPLPEALRGTLTGRFDFTYRDSMYFDIHNRLRAAAWSSGDARLIYERTFAAGSLAVEGFARNLWDTDRIGSIETSSGGLQEVAYYDAPRIYGFRVTGRWR